MADLKKWLAARRFDLVFDALVDRLEVETVSDLQFVTNDDIAPLGLMPVQRRHFEHELWAFTKTAQLHLPSGLPSAASHPAVTRAATQSGDTPRPRGGGPIRASQHACHVPRLRVSSSTVPQNGLADASGGGGDCLPNGAVELPTGSASTGGGERGHSLGDNAAEHDGNSVCEMVGAGGSSSSDDHTLGARASPVKRRKIFLSMKQKARSATTRAAGQSRVQRSERLGNGTPAGASEACSSAGGIRVGWSPVKGCTCGAILGALEPQFVVAKRKALEKKQSNARRNKNDVLLGYNYARLGLLVLTLLFDSRGSWLVHERCARELLGVSNSWMAGRHKLAVEAAQAPLVSMTKSAIAGSYDPDSMFKRIVRSTSCLLSVRQDFLVSPMTTRFELTAAVSHHGLHGKASNRRKTVQRDLFVAFVKKHRSPTGRTPDKCGRYHGAAYYLNSKWVILRPGRQKNGVVDSRRSFSEDFNAALVAAGWSRVHPDVPLRWLKELFGSTRRIEGTVSPSDEHITAYPHKTDACATCELLESDKRHSEQVLRAFPTMPSQRVKR